MAKNPCCAGGEPIDDDHAASVLSGGHPKSRPVATKWGMKDRSNDGDGPDDDPRQQSFNKGARL